MSAQENETTSSNLPEDQVDNVDIENDTNNWNTNTNQIQDTNLVTELEDIYKLRTNTDFTIIFQGGSIHCHKLVCAMYSSLLRKACCFNVVIINIDFPVDLFNKIYNWLVGIPTRFTRIELFPLYRMAEHFQIDRLIEMCLKILDSDYFNPLNAFFVVCELSNTGELFDVIVQSMILRTSQIYLPLFSTDLYRELGEREVVTMLSSDYAGVNGEIEILYGTFIWLQHDLPNRLASVERVLSCVRFGLLSRDLLDTICKCAPAPGDQQNEVNVPSQVNTPKDDGFNKFSLVVAAYLKSPNHRAIVEKSHLYSQFLTEYSDDEKKFHDKLKSENIPIWKCRQWVTDPLCPYHKLPKGSHCPNYLKVSYSDFIFYLKQLNKSDGHDFVSRFQINKFSTE